MTPTYRGIALALVLASGTLPAWAQKTIDFVSLGGNDCPPCRAWRAVELPKLQAMPEWQLMKYHFVTKSIQTPVPSATYFPAEAKHLQPALAEAGNGWTGSPQQAILVDGKVVDFWWGSAMGKGSAEDIAAMVRALHDGKPLPRPACAQLETRVSCKKAGG